MGTEKGERFRQLEEEAKAYDEREEPYLEQAERFRQRSIELIGNFAGRVLEIGCATGRLTEKMPKGMCLLVCLDVSVSKLGLARRRVGPGPEFVQADMEHLPFKPSVFDLVVSHYALHHAFSPRKAITESVEATRDCGRLFYAVPRASDDPKERRERMRQVRHGERLPAFTEAQFKGMLGRNAKVVRSEKGDFTGKVWAGRVLFLDCRRSPSPATQDITRCSGFDRPFAWTRSRRVRWLGRLPYSLIKRLCAVVDHQLDRLECPLVAIGGQPVSCYNAHMRGQATCPERPPYLGFLPAPPTG